MDAKAVEVVTDVARQTEFVGNEGYPILLSRTDLPLLTRLALTSDGSTTLLLRALAGTDVWAETVPVPRSSDLHHRTTDIRAVFGREDRIAVRRSRLRDSRGTMLSENVITFRDTDRDTLIPADNTPFGLHTRRLGMFDRRRIFRIGVTHDVFGALPAFSAGRVYEITFSTGQQVLVHEVFAPDILPVEQSLNDAGVYSQRLGRCP
ncbi:hypothetical protein [Nocardia sp. NPDC052566]|uniref:hypothetical protein n=1 Tax=Nocardia sp. NPDC052566 TaxID=3364330 RepID=UPI0037CAE383